MVTKLYNPNAIVVIYNYRDRLGDFKLTNNENSFDIDQTILNSLSLKSVTTQKTKSNPAGNFELRLAPIKNWVTAITPGSWCIILMSNEALDDTAKYGGGTVDEKSFKMMGRIESVRCVSTVNQTTGAIESEYIVTGVDWGVVFASKFYVDPLNRAPDEQSAIGMSARFGYGEYLLNSINYDATAFGNSANTHPDALVKKADNENKKGAVVEKQTFINGSTEAAGKSSPTGKKKLPSSIDNVNFILQLWGQSDPITANMKNKTGITTKSEQRFTIPDDLVKYMGFIDDVDEPSGVIYQILQQKGGKLIGYDKYEDKDYSSGIIDFSNLLGEHPIWQLLTSNSNELINELIPEIRFENGKPTLTLYNRVRPFAVNDLSKIKLDTNVVGDNGIGIAKGADGKETTHKALVDPYISKFSDVRQIDIDPSDVIMCSYGTNWRDRVNFIEVTIGRTLYQEMYSNAIKLDSQFIDEESIARDGLLSMMVSTTYIPTLLDVANPIGVSAYKHALKEWYFNTHKMFNGTLSLVGQDQYIQVGDNIMVPTKVLNKNYNINAAQRKTDEKTYLLAHVESISHQATVDNNGSRIFTTSINFVRGIITNEDGELVSTDDHVGAVDQDAQITPPAGERNREIIARSGPMDPDQQKYPILKGDKDYDGEE
ncbi:hypothetical protein UFOVP53_223 [uncultured Caudovirales phage]|uniref:Uncharacterized protein n=1 Tax=uncultured Caudovirales phage TaxID=2100421 RepID=A0A6J5KXH6_9CAUD|nr:hypothetical protein UFOVP53_223 [uncultured Caudovirales phage]